MMADVPLMRRPLNHSGGMAWRRILVVS